MKSNPVAVMMKFGVIAALTTAGVALAQQPAAAVQAPPATTPLLNGSYIAPIINYLRTDDDDVGSGPGGDLRFGFRNGHYATEIGFSYANLSGTTQKGLHIKGLLFPFMNGLPGAFLTAGVGVYETRNHPHTDRIFRPVAVMAGAGYLYPLQIGRYEFAIRAEVNYRYSQRSRYLDSSDIDIAAPENFSDVIGGIGLQLPIGLKPVPTPVPEAPIAVVPVPAQACSDGLDNDEDGKIDFPADPGCDSADDADEADPVPVVVAAPVPACKTPAVGEKVSLKGCGSGDVIVLRGVNFDFNQARLTVNAKTILDGVAEELKAYPTITVELGGHTDSKGSDEYNLKLSDKRAASVVQYLKSMGIDGSRMVSVGYGEGNAVADNETDEGRELNRRVELKIVGGVGTTATAD